MTKDNFTPLQNEALTALEQLASQRWLLAIKTMEQIYEAEAFNEQVEAVLMHTSDPLRKWGIQQLLKHHDHQST